MIGSAIREIAAARTVPLICAAFNEDITQVWNLESPQQLSEFSARFTFGARTLGMHPDGTSIVTGVSATDGSIASYSVPDGALMWLRHAVVYATRIQFGQSGQYIYCTLQNRKVERIDALTGITKEVFRDAAFYVEGPDMYSLGL
jgi:WD40 repeat protein